MKRHLIRLFLALLLPGLLSAQTTLRYSDHEPLGNMRTRFFKDVFFAAVERESKGRLRIEDHWNGSISTGYDALRLVGEGKVTDIAVVVPEYTAKQLPLEQLLKSFPTGPSGDRQVAFFRRAYTEIPALSAELGKNNVVPIFLGTGYPAAFLNTQPLRGLKSFQGQNWRTASFWHEDFLRNAQANPVSIPWGDGIFKAIQAKSLDGLLVNVDSAQDLNIEQVAPNILISRNLWLGHLYIVAMNRVTWNGLAPEDRESIQRAAQTAYTHLGRVMDQSFDAMVDDLKKSGAKVGLLNGRELKVWKTISSIRTYRQPGSRTSRAKTLKRLPRYLEKSRYFWNYVVATHQTSVRQRATLTNRLRRVKSCRAKRLKVAILAAHVDSVKRGT